MREVDAVKLRCAGYEPPRNGTVAPSCGVMTEWDQMFVSSLARPPACRSLQDLQVIYYGLSGLEALQTLRDSALRALCKVARSCATRSTKLTTFCTSKCIFSAKKKNCQDSTDLWTPQMMRPLLKL
jgi:hypothetical protein